MRKLFTVALGLLLLGVCQLSQAQKTGSAVAATPRAWHQDATIPPAGRTCASEQKMQESLANNPELQKEWETLTQLTEQMERENEYQKTSGIITIPTVVHVVYRTSAGNITDSRIQEQIDVLNADYRRLNSDASNTRAQFVNVAGDCQIEFCLANKDPQGNATNGITRRQTTTSNIGGTSQYYQSANGTPIWDRSKYMNIWVCEIGNQILGFAYKPGTAASSYDGIVIDYRYFGKTGASAPFNRGRTATHEVGHWLGLDHIWGDGPCGQDDGIADTPESDNPNYNCPLSHSSCGTLDMVENYMDYTNDACMNIFTGGQCTRMNSVLSGARGTLVFSDGCSGGGNPSACDTTQLGYPLVGTGVVYLSSGTGAWGYVSGHNNYQDKSKANRFANAQGYTSCEGVRYQFAIGSAANTSSKVVAKIWDEVGGEPGTVLAQQDLLIDDIINAGGDIVVTFGTPATLSGPFYAGVEITYAAGDTVALLTNSDGDVTTGTAWEQFSDNSWHSYNSSSSWQIEVDHAIFPIVGGTGINVSVTPNGPTINAGGSVNLTASGATTYSWSPATGLNTTSGASVTASPSITTTYTVTGTDATGNCTGDKTVTVTVIPVAIEEALFGNNSLSVFPNPNNGTFTLEFNQAQSKDLNIEITNMMGQVVFEETLSRFSGNYQNTIHLNKAAGAVYFLRISDGVNNVSRKVLIQ